MQKVLFGLYDRFSKLHKTLHDYVARATESQLSQEAQQEQRKRPRIEKRDASYAVNLPSQSGESTIRDESCLLCCKLYVTHPRCTLDIRGRGHFF